MSDLATGDDVRQMSFGKGGAGNIRKATNTAPSVDALQTPPLKGKNYSTGRGGTGNIAKNDPENPEIARKTQDVDVPAIKIVEEQHHIGRGGAANAYKPSEEEIKAPKEDNEKVRTSSTSSFESPKGVAGMARKGVQVLDGPKD